MLEMFIIVYMFTLDEEDKVHSNFREGNQLISIPFMRGRRAMYGILSRKQNLVRQKGSSSPWT